MRPSIVITGANGFIGSYLTSHLSTRGFSVTAFVHALPAERRPDVVYRSYDLDGAIAGTELTDCGCVIHCAYTRNRDGARADEVNIEGTHNLYRAAQEAGVKRFVYLSSLSAHEGALSHYGRVKLETELMLDPRVDLILRPGLVIGHGGLFQDIADYVQGSRVLPLIDGGRSQIQCVAVDDLARCIEVAITEDIVGEYALAAKDPITLRELYRCITEKANRKALLVPVSFWLADVGLVLLKAVHIKTPVGRESLLGLRQNRIWDVAEAAGAFGVELKSCRQAIEQLD